MKYKFNNKEYTALRRVVLAVVKKYISEHDNITYNELKNKFPKSVHGTLEIVLNKQDYDKYSENVKDPDKRYLVKKEEWIDIVDDKICVCSQWGDDTEKNQGNKKPFFNHIENNFKYIIEEYNMIDKNNKNETEQDKSVKYYFLNQILYGPPGTGKTYNTIDKALQIIDGKVPKNRKEAKERFEALKEAGQIAFVTFHQSYGYEEFVEGIKADVDSDNIRYSIEEGIFQKLSRIAERNYKNANNTSKGKKEFEIVFKEKILDRLEDKLKIDTPKKYFYITDINDRTIFFEKASGNTGHTLSIKSLKKMYELGSNDFLLGGLSVYYQPILELLLEDAIEEKEPEALKNYILIIDEINRGNISKIFGELITLIEESKRLGNDEAMEVILPYSGEKFGVPNNLYILGTMNTADRSIALMDTALRRRFEFEEMMPDPRKLKIIKVADKSIDLVQLLIIINQRIEYLYDRDHTIGHAYFMGVSDKEELDSVMRNKVIPLLQEYFYDDWEKIQLVLNDGFIKRDTQNVSELFEAIEDEYVEDDKYVYSIASSFSLESYIKFMLK
ncbi:MAG: restriction endonuclease [Sulfurovum sp.]|nr:MAG: restriction endonuclease [Sulfurovum sp.]